MARSEKTNLYLGRDSRSARLHERHAAVMPGGNTRLPAFTFPYPSYAQRGYGCMLVDEEGQERIDFDNNFTTLITGHVNPGVVEAVISQIQRGSAFPWPTESEIRLAEMIASRVATVEHVVFANSGTEAVMAAVKAARAYTGRTKIARFEGCYHGTYDPVQVSLDPTPEAGGDPRFPRPVLHTAGDSPAALNEVVVLPFNDADAADTILEMEKSSVAAVIVDPLPNRAGLMHPLPGFMSAVREITRRYGILLISDEVISFRLDYHGSQRFFGYDADLTALGKIIGGGYPIGAVGGSAEVMSVFDPGEVKPKLPHGGTFSGNPVSMVAGVANLEQLTPEAFDRLNRLGEAARSRLNALFQRTGFEAQASGKGSLFKILMTSRPLVNYRDSLLQPERRPLAREFYLGMLARGVVLTNAGLGSISTPMGMKEIDLLVDAVEDWVREKGR